MFIGKPEFANRSKESFFMAPTASDVFPEGIMDNVARLLKSTLR